VHVVRHQAPGPHFDVGGAAVLGEQVSIKRVVGIAKEGARAAIAALGDMVRMTRDDDTGETGHAASFQCRCCESIKCTVNVTGNYVTVILFHIDSLITFHWVLRLERGKIGRGNRRGDVNCERVRIGTCDHYYFFRIRPL
jgi:hypothetical protein